MAFVLPLSAQANVELIMVEEKGCMWCARWTEEIGPAYPNTAEGKAAPLRRIDMHAAIPDDLSFESSLRLSPTFVLVRDGKELQRLEGYPGDDFFWFFLQKMLDEAKVKWSDDAER